MSTAIIRSRAPGFRSSKTRQCKRKRGKMLRKELLNRCQATQRNFQPLVNLVVEEKLLGERNLKR